MSQRPAFPTQNQTTPGEIGEIPIKPFSGTDYTSTEIYETESKALLQNIPWFVAHISELNEPGQYVVREILGDSIIVVRGSSGKLRAFANACIHRMARITKASSGITNEFVCPYHGWRYDTDGMLIKARGCSSMEGKMRLKTVAIREVSGLVYVAINNNPENTFKLKYFDGIITNGLESFNIRNAGVVKKEILAAKVNWKLWIENFLECLHCHTAHPQLSSVESHIKAFEAKDYTGFYHQQSAWQAQARSKGWQVFPKREVNTSDSMFQFIETLALGNGRKAATRSSQSIGLPLVSAAFEGGLVYGALSPFLHFTITVDHAIIFDFIPTGPESMKITIHWIGRDWPKDKIDELTWLWSSTIRQDIAITETVQINATSQNLPQGLYTEDEFRSLSFAQWVRKHIPSLYKD